MGAYIRKDDFSASLEEVYEVNQETGVTASLGQRIADGLSYSAKGLVSGAQNLLVWISYHIFGVVAAALILTPVIVISIRQLKKETNPRQNSSGQK